MQGSVEVLGIVPRRWAASLALDGFARLKHAQGCGTLRIPRHFLPVRIAGIDWHNDCVIGGREPA